MPNLHQIYRSSCHVFSACLLFSQILSFYAFLFLSFFALSWTLVSDLYSFSNFLSIWNIVKSFTDLQLTMYNVQTLRIVYTFFIHYLCTIYMVILPYIQTVFHNIFTIYFKFNLHSLRYYASVQATAGVIITHINIKKLEETAFYAHNA